MTFLCQQDKEQVLESTQQAIEYWHYWMEQGGECFEQHQFQRACSLFGCSYEVADCLLANKDDLLSHQDLKPIERYMIAGHHLAESFGRNRQCENELHFLLTIHTRLLKLSSNDAILMSNMRQHLQISMALLTRYRKLHGAFNGYLDCYMETRLCLDRLLH